MENFLKKLITGAIKGYQRTISPDHSEWGRARYPHGFCRYYPSCSEYTKQSIEAAGVLKGIIKSMWRIARCNPLSNGGYDPVSRDS